MLSPKVTCLVVGTCHPRGRPPAEREPAGVAQSPGDAPAAHAARDVLRADPGPLVLASRRVHSPLRALGGVLIGGALIVNIVRLGTGLLVEQRDRRRLRRHGAATARFWR
jgi:hypothetical protein